MNNSTDTCKWRNEARASYATDDHVKVVLQFFEAQKSVYQEHVFSFAIEVRAFLNYKFTFKRECVELFCYLE